MGKVFFDAETIDMEDAGEIDVKNTRSMMREGGEIYWNANDMLGVFTQNGSPQKFKTANGGKVTRFEVNPAKRNVALYKNDTCKYMQKRYV